MFGKALEQILLFLSNCTFDTILAIISCITGIVALFIGGAAYKQCKIIKNSFNDKKELNDNSQDNSQKAGRDLIVNNNCDVNALASLSAQNFKESLNAAYEMFEKKTDDNLHRIIDTTNQIIRENQISLGAYTKLDWINVYFENAKTSNDEYMQNIWAKVLAKELAFPGSFSLKTLDVLKNMSADDFRLFEKMCSLAIDSGILRSTIYNKYGLQWVNQLKLKEFGLLSVAESERTYTISPFKDATLLCSDEYILRFNNETETSIDFKVGEYTLTYSALELESVAQKTYDKSFVFDFSKEMVGKKPKNLEVTLHKLDYISGTTVHYDTLDLLAEGVAI